MKHAKMILAFIMVAALLGLSACSDQGTTDGQGQKPSAGIGTGIAIGRRYAGGKNRDF